MLFSPKFRKLRLKLIRNISETDASIYNIPHVEIFRMWKLLSKSCISC